MSWGRLRASGLGQQPPAGSRSTDSGGASRGRRAWRRFASPGAGWVGDELGPLARDVGPRTVKRTALNRSADCRVVIDPLPRQRHERGVLRPACRVLVVDFRRDDRHGCFATGAARRSPPGLEVVPAVGDDDEAAGAAVPPILASAEANTSVQHVDGGFAVVLVLAELLAAQQRDHGLPQDVIVPAVDSGCAAPFEEVFASLSCWRDRAVREDVSMLHSSGAWCGAGGSEGLAVAEELVVLVVCPSLSRQRPAGSRRAAWAAAPRTGRRCDAGLVRAPSALLVGASPCDADRRPRLPLEDARGYPKAARRGARAPSAAAVGG